MLIPNIRASTAAGSSVVRVNSAAARSGARVQPDGFEPVADASSVEGRPGNSQGTSPDYPMVA